LAKSAAIESQLKLEDSPLHSSLVQMKSQSALREEAAAFEKSKQETLHRNSALLEAKRKEYLDSLAVLNSDASPSSFIEQEDFFVPAKQAAAKLHSVVMSITKPTPNIRGLDVDLD